MSNEHSDLGQIESDSAITGQPHLYTQQEVLRMGQSLLQGYHPPITLSLSTEVTLFIASYYGKLDVVLGYGVRRAHSEDVSGDREVGGESEVVEGDFQGQKEALACLSAR